MCREREIWERSALQGLMSSKPPLRAGSHAGEAAERLQEPEAKEMVSPPPDTQGWCTHELSETTVACTEPARAQARCGPSIERGKWT